MIRFIVRTLVAVAANAVGLIVASIVLDGFSINVAPDLAHFGGIVPCGIAEYGVTSLERLGLDPSMKQLDKALERSFPSFLNALSNISEAA